ncbi:MAG TPA: cupredoxin domain-containing protein [Dehalococcoidia bacterium]|nr:cupredoxin domain-containing protein [Dehalococcoidia bacterium]
MGSFGPGLVITIASLTTIVAGVISFFAPTMQGSRGLAVGAGSVAVVLVVASVAMSLSASSEAAQAGDVTLLAERSEFPETLDASAGLIGFHVDNKDAVRHTFVIEGTDVKLELPGFTQRRVEVQLAAGDYPYICDVVGHERMAGVITVR